MPPLNRRTLYIAIGVIGGFMLGVIVAVLLAGKYNILGTLCWSGLLAPLGMFGFGFLGAIINIKED